MITLANIKDANSNDLPNEYSPYLADIQEAVITGLYKKDDEVKLIVNAFLDTVNYNIYSLQAPRHKGLAKKGLDQCGRLKKGYKFNGNGKIVKVEAESKEGEKKEKGTRKERGKKGSKSIYEGVKTMQVKNVFTDEKRFQNRKKLNENTVNQIVENFNLAKFDAPVVWKDSKDNKVYILAGHHRFEAIKKLKRKTLPVRFLEATESEAIKYAKVESNSNRTLESPIERASIYREMLENSTKKEVREEAKKLEGKNAKFILNLAHLNPKGIAIDTLERLETTDKNNAGIIEKLCDWIGEARERNSKLTNAHEKEMFDFLNDDDSSKRFKAKADFLQKVYAISSGIFFDFSKPLNLKNHKHKSEGESIYEAEFQEIKSELNKLLQRKTDLKDRVNNPLNKNFIDPDSSDYGYLMQNYDKTITKIEDEIKFAQKKLVELQSKKSTYVNSGANQGALFGYKEQKEDVSRDINLGYDSSELDNDEGEDTPSSLEILKSKRKTPIETAVTPIVTPIERPNLTRAKNPLVKNLTDTKVGANNIERYKITGDISDFLGDIEIKPKDSLAITLDAEQGSGKTRFVFQLLNKFAETGYKCLFVSLEEHPESSLFNDKVKEYINPANEHLIDTIGELPNWYTTLAKLVPHYDCVFIDSWSKIAEEDRNVDFDKDLRKKFDGKLFVSIFQRTSSGKMRGGSKASFDGDIILRMEKDPDYRKSFVYANKNRYQNKPLDQLKYNIYTKSLVKENSTAEVTPSSTMLGYTEV